MKKRKVKVKSFIILGVVIILLIGGIILLTKITQNKKEDAQSSPNQEEIEKEQPQSSPSQEEEEHQGSPNEEETNKEPKETPPVSKYTDEKQEKLAKLDNIQNELDYFKMDYLDRYIAYSEKNPTLSKKDVVIRVNIGLDQEYYTNTKQSPYLNQNYILSNKYTSLGEYVPENLEEVSASCSSGTRLLVHEARVAFENMCNKAKSDGYTIQVMSAYRSYQYQVGLYQRYVDRDGVKEADTYSARPGFSEHQTGLVADIDNGSIAYTSFHKAKEYSWMKENAYKYGFIERYPEGKENITGYTYESWHYRYVGVDIATYIHEHNITFDEYYVQFIEGKK